VKFLVRSGKKILFFFGLLRENHPQHNWDRLQVIPTKVYKLEKIYQEAELSTNFVLT